MVALTYVMTLLLEWPFVALCLRKTDGWFLKSIWGSLVVQSASYLVLFGWYWAASGTSLYTNLTIVQPTAISLPKDAMLYYMAEDNGDVFARDLSQTETRKICMLKSVEGDDRLFFCTSGTASGRWDLVAGSLHRENLPNPSPSDSVVSAGLRCDAAEPPWAGHDCGGEVPHFRSDRSGWQFQFGWMACSLDGKNTKDGRNVDVSMETPFLRWPVRYPTQLPSGQVVFQLGRNQICVLDPNERKIALLAKGRWPVVSIKHGLK